MKINFLGFNKPKVIPVTLAQKRKTVFNVLDIMKQVKPDPMSVKQEHDRFNKIDPVCYSDNEIESLYTFIKSEFQILETFRKVVSDKIDRLFTAGGWELSKQESTGNIITMIKGTLKLIIDTKLKSFKVVDGYTVKVNPSPIDSLEAYLTKPVTQTAGSL